MIPAGSRYEQADHQFTLAHSYNEWGYPVLEGDSINPKVKLVSRETLFLLRTAPESPAPLQEYYAKETEGFQFLAYKFMADARRWWELCEVNPGVWYPLDLKPGDYLRIPS